MKLKNRINKRKFKQFTEFNKSEGKYFLNDTKTHIAEYFGISTRTLRRWMVKNGFDYLIQEFRGRRYQRTKTEKPESSKVKLNIQERMGSKMIEWPQNSNKWKLWSKGLEEHLLAELNFPEEEIW